MFLAIGFIVFIALWPTVFLAVKLISLFFLTLEPLQNGNISFLFLRDDDKVFFALRVGLTIYLERDVIVNMLSLLKKEHWDIAPSILVMTWPVLQLTRHL